MKNIPRIFAGDNINPGDIVPVARDVAHYLTRVMRTHECVAFGGGREFLARLSDDANALVIGNDTGRPDPAGDIRLMFAPIKRTDDLINMATQMGVAEFLPVITEHTVAAHINWDRMRKIAVEASEQSNRNSVPRILEPVKFSEIDLHGIVFADERAAYGRDSVFMPQGAKSILVGPEGGFSDSEFAALDANGACGISLGNTILRAEVAAVVAIAKITK